MLNFDGAIAIATLCTDATTLRTYWRAIAATLSRRWFSYANWKAIVNTDLKLYALDAAAPAERAPPGPSREDARSSVRVAAGPSCCMTQ